MRRIRKIRKKGKSVPGKTSFSPKFPGHERHPGKGKRQDNADQTERKGTAALRPLSSYGNDDEGEKEKGAEGKEGERGKENARLPSGIFLLPECRRSERREKEAAWQKSSAKQPECRMPLFSGVHPSSLCGFSAPSSSLFQLRKGCACRYEL